MIKVVPALKPRLQHGCGAGRNLRLPIFPCEKKKKKESLVYIYMFLVTSPYLRCAGLGRCVNSAILSREHIENIETISVPDVLQVVSIHNTPKQTRYIYLRDISACCMGQSNTFVTANCAGALSCLVWTLFRFYNCAANFIYSFFFPNTRRRSIKSLPYRPGT